MVAVCLCASYFSVSFPALMLSRRAWTGLPLPLLERSRNVQCPPQDMDGAGGLVVYPRCWWCPRLCSAAVVPPPRRLLVSDGEQRRVISCLSPITKDPDAHCKRDQWFTAPANHPSEGNRSTRPCFAQGHAEGCGREEISHDPC